MEWLVLASIVVVVGSLCGLVAIGRIGELARRVQELETAIAELRLGAATKPESVARTPAPSRTPSPPADLTPPPANIAPPPADLAPPPARVAPPPAAPARAAAPPPRSFEELVGKRWMTWAGALALVVAAGLFVDLAVDRGWLGPLARTLLAAIAGAALLVAGLRADRREMRALAQGLIGGGIAILYVAAFAGYRLYHLVGAVPAFGAFVAITIAGMALAVRHDARPIALLAVIGGLLAPVLVSSGGDQRDALCVYLTILDLGVLWVAFRKLWRALDTVALTGTWLLFTGWYAEHGATAARAPTLAWVFAFHALFVGLPFAHHLRRRAPLTLERFAAALASAALSLGYSSELLAGHRVALGALAAALAAAHVALGAIARVRLPDDRRALAGFWLLAATFSTVALALLLGARASVIAWAGEGVALAAFGYRYAYAPARRLGAIVLALAIARLAWIASDAHPEAVPLVGIDCLTALATAAACAAYAFVHHRRAATGADRRLQIAVSIAGGLLVIAAAHGQLVAAIDASLERDLANGAVAIPWFAGALAFAFAGTRVRPRAGADAILGTAVACIVVGELLALTAYADLPGAATFALNAKFALAVAGVAVALVVARALEPAGARAVSALALLVLWGLCSCEAYGYFPSAQQPALSITWGVFATALIAIGFALDRRALRIAGLALLGITAVKLLLVDLAELDQIYRVLSFAVAGGAMMGVAYVYHRVDRRFARKSSAD